jgi:hypothetical protein
MQRLRTSTLLPLLGFGLPFLAVLAAIVTFDPYYGIVDDASLLGLVSEVAQHGFGTVYWHRVSDDVTGWGMVRPWYWALAYVEYRIGTEGPLALYVVNWAVTGAALFAAGLALTRAFRIPAERRAVFLGVYGATVFVFPWTLDLFAFPSYQEKWVIAAAALGFAWFAAPRAGLPGWAWYTTSVLVVAIGSATKAQFVLFLPAYVLLLLDQRRRGVTSTARVLFLSAVGLLAAAALRAVAWYGSYTSSFSADNVPTQLRDHYFWLVGALAVAWAVYAFERARRGRGTLFLDLVPLAVFAAFAVVFAQWQGWLFTVIAPVVAGAFALAVTRLGRERLAVVVVAAGVVWAGAWIAVRGNELYGSLASIREFARSPVAVSLARRGEPVFLSCQEGADAISGYVRREQGLPLGVRPRSGVPWNSAAGSPPPPAFRFALADDHLCPALIDPAEWRAVWRSSHRSGFVLYERAAGTG